MEGGEYSCSIVSELTRAQYYVQGKNYFVRQQRKQRWSLLYLQPRL